MTQSSNNFLSELLDIFSFTLGNVEIDRLLEFLASMAWNG